MQTYRLFFTLLTTCIGFIMVVGTIVGLGFVVIEIFSIPPYDSGARYAVFGGLAVCFLVFMRAVSPAIGNVTKGLDKNDGTPGSAEEARIMQDLHHGLGQMERRLESLETILIDRAPSPKAEDVRPY